jgi:hypothetical protein
MSGVRLPSPGPASTSFPSSPIGLIASAPDSERFCEIASLGLSVARIHSKTSYSNAAPSGSFSLNHSSAATGLAKTLI